MECPNSDPNFDKVLSKWVEVTPSTRKNIYYGICIWVRLILYSLVFYYRDSKYIPYIVGLFSLLAIANLKDSVSNPGRQWWSKRFDLVIAVLLLVACIMAIFDKVNIVVIPVLLYASLLGGFLQSFFIKFC